MVRPLLKMPITESFKRANIRRSIEAELYFYSRIFGFTLSDQVEPVEIENLEKK